MKMQNIVRGIAKATTVGLGILGTTYGAENNSYEVRAFLRIRDSQGFETRRVVADFREYTLEAVVENVSELQKSVIGVGLGINMQRPLNMAGAVSFDDDAKEHYLSGDYFSNLKMGRNNLVMNGGSMSRETKFEAGQPREGVSQKGASVVGKWKFQALEQTNIVYSTLGFDRFVAFDSDVLKKPVRTRSLKLQVVPQGYNELNLMFDYNDGETPANDSFKYDVFGRATPVMVPGSVPEPIVIGNGKANVLERSVGDASGPWTAVWTNRPTAGNMSASSAFSDREMKGFDKVFYRVREYTGQ